MADNRVPHTEDFKYTRFAKHMATWYNPPRVWNYVAQDDYKKCVLEVRCINVTDSDSPGTMDVRSGNHFNQSTDTLEFVEVSAEEFWAAYKLQTIRYLELYYKHNPDKKTWEDQKK